MKRTKLLWLWTILLLFGAIFAVQVNAAEQLSIPESSAIKSSVNKDFNVPLLGFFVIFAENMETLSYVLNVHDYSTAVNALDKLRAQKQEHFDWMVAYTSMWENCLPNFDFLSIVTTAAEQLFQKGLEYAVISEGLIGSASLGGALGFVSNAWASIGAGWGIGQIICLLESYDKTLIYSISYMTASYYEGILEAYIDNY